MWALLQSVAHLQTKGVIHRDIKPSNFLYDPNEHTGLLIDFGLSEIEVDKNFQPVKEKDDEIVKRIVQLQKSGKIKGRTGTKGYMPPEALFHYHHQTGAVDIWACGVIYLSLLSQRHPILSLNNSSKVKNFVISNLIPLVCLFGSNSIKEIAFKYGKYINISNLIFRLWNSNSRRNAKRKNSLERNLQNIELRGI